MRKWLALLAASCLALVAAWGPSPVAATTCPGGFPNGPFSDPFPYCADTMTAPADGTTPITLYFVAPSPLVDSISITATGATFVDGTEVFATQGFPTPNVTLSGSAAHVSRDSQLRLASSTPGSASVTLSYTDSGQSYVVSTVSFTFAVSNHLPVGSHDGSTLAVAQIPDCFANGWAVDPDQDTARLAVRILADGAVIWSGPADEWRPDVLAAGYGDGYSGFEVSLVELISSDVPHVIRAQAQDADTGAWQNLDWTPRTITCTNLDSWGADGGQGVVARAECVAAGWAVDLDTPTGPRVQVRISVDGRVIAETTADLFRPELPGLGLGDGYSGFRMDLWGKVSPNRAHLVTLDARDTTAKRLWVPLYGTPFDLICTSR